MIWNNKRYTDLEGLMAVCSLLKFSILSKPSNGFYGELKVDANEGVISIVCNTPGLFEMTFSQKGSNIAELSSRFTSYSIDRVNSDNIDFARFDLNIFGETGKADTHITFFK